MEAGRRRGGEEVGLIAEIIDQLIDAGSIDLLQKAQNALLHIIVGHVLCKRHLRFLLLLSQ